MLKRFVMGACLVLMFLTSADAAMKVRLAFVEECFFDGVRRQISDEGRGRAVSVFNEASKLLNVWLELEIATDVVSIPSVDFYVTMKDLQRNYDQILTLALVRPEDDIDCLVVFYPEGTVCAEYLACCGWYSLSRPVALITMSGYCLEKPREVLLNLFLHEMGHYFNDFYVQILGAYYDDFQERLERTLPIHASFGYCNTLNWLESWYHGLAGDPKTGRRGGFEKTWLDSFWKPSNCFFYHGQKRSETPFHPEGHYNDYLDEDGRLGRVWGLSSDSGENGHLLSLEREYMCLVERDGVVDNPAWLYCGQVGDEMVIINQSLSADVVIQYIPPDVKWLKKDDMLVKEEGILKQPIVFKPGESILVCYKQEIIPTLNPVPTPPAVPDLSEPSTSNNESEGGGCNAAGAGVFSLILSGLFFLKRKTH